MSLMLEALRRAERQAQEGARGAAALEREPPAATGLSLEPAESPAARARQELAEPRVARGEVGRAASASPALADSDLQGKVSRQRYYRALALLGVAALSVIAYVWPPRQPSAPAVRNPPVLPASRAASVAAAPDPGPLAIPGLPAGIPERLSNPPTEAAQAAAPAARIATVAGKPVAVAPAAEMRAAQNMLPARRVEVRVHEQVEAGYAAFQNGNVEAARDAYRRALDSEPRNRDALLGMAAVETRLRRPDLAEAHYLMLLRMDPADPYAQAGLLALRAAEIDPVHAESRLKTLLAANPEASALHFALGNQYARQGRWAEAQQAYLRALAGDESNPDIAFNLAVSLDRMHQTASAREHYERALALAQRRGTAFPVEAARSRLQQLGR